MAFNTKDLSRDLAKSTVHIVTGAVSSGSVDPVSVLKVILDVGGLCWKTGAYIHHKGTVQKSLAVCLEEYREVGYLATVTTSADAKPTIWRTTPRFREANVVHRVYPDIERYLKDGDFTKQELDLLGFNSTITIYAEESVCKGLGDLMGKLSACCTRYGVRDVTKTDAQKRIANVSAMQMGAIGLQNAFIAEGQRRERGEEASVVPVLGRILGISALCGITDIGLSEITTLIGKGPLFETVARSRIAKFRNAHASEVFNTLLFSGNTESTARGFGTLATRFSGERVIVGRVKAAKKSEFLPEYASFSCELSGPPEKKYAVGTPVYMTAGWANLIQRREQFEKQHGVFAQMAHLHAPVKAEDIHGNVYMSAGKLGKIVFKVKELPNGTLMAKPRNFERFDYKSGANYDKGKNSTKASGEEKIFGGVVGPPVCPCGGTADVNKGGLTKKWKLGSGIKISSREYVGNSIAHTQEHSTNKVAILWRPGDWIMGAFLMQILPQSSYLQGRAECLHCAVENAALYGCAEVIACGGGRVSAEALEMELAKPQPSSPLPALTKIDTSVPSSLYVSTTRKETAIALFDYETEVAGDLGFHVGDVIEVVSRTATAFGWWTGTLNGKHGQFPGNYVRMEPALTVASTLPTPPMTPSTPKLDRVMSTESSPASPPPAYGSMSPGPPAAEADYFAIIDARGDKIMPAVTIRRKPVPSAAVEKQATSMAPNDTKSTGTAAGATEDYHRSLIRLS